MSEQERRPGKSRLVYDKATRTIRPEPGDDEFTGAAIEAVSAIARLRLALIEFAPVHPDLSYAVEAEKRLRLALAKHIAQSQRSASAMHEEKST